MADVSVKAGRRRNWSGIALVLALCIFWQASVSSGLVDSPNWPALSTVLRAMLEGFRSGEWITVFGSSLYRMTTGYFIGCVTGIAVGVLLATNRTVQAIFGPTLELLRPIPIPAIIPPLIFILGVDNTLKIFVIAFSVFFPVLISTHSGVLAVDPLHLQVARTFRLPTVRRVLRVQLPSAIPYVLTGMRTSLALSLIVTVIAEMIAGSEGIGYYIVSMQFAMRAADMYAAVLMLSAIGYLLNTIFVALEARAIRWARQNEERMKQ
jgi:NitT/TauT family transport system permease protein/sulfonate transport system permease protein